MNRPDQHNNSRLLRTNSFPALSTRPSESKTISTSTTLATFTATSEFKLYNTLSRKIEVFQPNQEKNVGLYACGFTVYDYTHLGHLRKYSMDDVLVRTLRVLGYRVTFVQNITDVGHLVSDQDQGEDKLEKGAKKYGKTVWDVAHKFEEYFFYSMDLMGNLRPDVSCKATDHIKEQLQLVLELEKRGHTYIIENDGVYFDTSTIDDYGKLAQLNPEKLREGARLGVVVGKRNPTDFALWKFERSGENRAMVWSSPWHPRSFPGWHVECSAMSVKYLGEQIDIHTGGIDHIAVHHSNEIAQTEQITGKKPFVKYWVHHNHLRIDDEKMSKSLGNFFTIDDVISRGYSPKALRLLFLSTHYRSEMNFTWQNLAGSEKSWQKLLAIYGKTLEAKSDNIDEAKTNYSPKNLKYYELFLEAIKDDLNTARAVAVLWEVAKNPVLLPQEKSKLLDYFDKFLGFNFRSEWLRKKANSKTNHNVNYQENQTSANWKTELDLDNEPKSKSTKQNFSQKLADLVVQRQRARASQNWQLADDLRQQIFDLGYLVQDTASGEQELSAVG
jgi:cysteinyl-tRNA synthetase